MKEASAKEAKGHSTLSSLGPNVLGREKEAQLLRNQLDRFVRAGENTAIFLYGNAGSGKTLVERCGFGSAASGICYRPDQLLSAGTQYSPTSVDKHP